MDIKPTNREENFYEDELIRLKRNSPNSDGQTTTVSTTTEDRRPFKSKYIQIKNPEGSDLLYFSLKGYENENSVEVVVYNYGINGVTLNLHQSFNRIFLFISLVISLAHSKF